MRSHGSAKTNVYQRRLLIRRVRHHGWTQRQAAEALGVSVRTVAKWLARDRTALGDRSSRPHRQPRRVSASREAAIVALRRTRATAWQISTALRIPRSTVTRVLARAGLNRVALVEPSGPVQRYVWPHVGDLLHIDLKRLGRVVGIGHRKLPTDSRPRYLARELVKLERDPQSFFARHAAVQLDLPS